MCRQYVIVTECIYIVIGVVITLPALFSKFLADALRRPTCIMESSNLNNIFTDIEWLIYDVVITWLSEG